MSETFKFVIVGSGNICKTYVTAIDKLPGCDLVGLVSRKLKKPEFLKDNHSIEIAESIKKIQAEFNAVILATPNGLHHKGAIEAADMGKHVLTEKVLDISIENMDVMINACKKNNVKLGTAYQRRMSPDNIIMKKILDEKKLGKIFAADLSAKFYRGQDYYDSGVYRGTMDIDGGGPFIQQAAHNIDIFCWFFGLPDKVVSMLDTFNHNIECEDHGSVLLKYKDGMSGTIIASTIAKPGFPGRLEIHSKAGTVIMENDIITTWAIDGMENPSKAGEFKVHSGAASASVSDTAEHEAILKDFIDAVQEDREPAVSKDSARMATELILKIYDNTIS